MFRTNRRRRMQHEHQNSRLTLKFQLLVPGHVFMFFACFLLGKSPASEVYMPTFRTTLSAPSSYLPAYEDGTDRVVRNVGI